MMRNFVLGLAVCGSVAGVMHGNANGMENIEYLVSSLAKDPNDREGLNRLVSELVNKERGKENTNQAIDALRAVCEKDRQNETFDKIICMLWTIAYHWEVGYRLVHSNVQYYVDGALKGEFGPYDF